MVEGYLLSRKQEKRYEDLVEELQNDGNNGKRASTKKGPFNGCFLCQASFSHMHDMLYS